MPPLSVTAPTAPRQCATIVVVQNKEFICTCAIAEGAQTQLIERTLKAFLRRCKPFI